jgi:putative transposase
MRSIITKINSNNKQKTKFLQHAGVSRHAWNWGLDLCIKKIYAKECTPSAIDLHKLLVKEVKPKNAWYYDSSKCAPQQALRYLETAFKRFWKIHHPKNKNLPMNKKYLKKYLKKFHASELKKLTTEHEKGFPKFKKKGMSDGFYLEGSFKIINNAIKIPFIGWIKTYEKLPEGIEIKNVTISRKSDEWFISFISDRKPKLKKTKSKSKVGIDLGIKTAVAVSSCQTFESPKAYKKNKSKLKRLQKSLSRKFNAHKKLQEAKDAECKKNKTEKIKIPYGSNYQKSKIKLAKTHQRIANIRLDNTHKITNELSKNHREISIENLNVAGMMKNHHLASAISDGGFFEFKRQLIYKCEWRSVKLNIIDRWFPSSQLCSCCGHKQKMPLKKRIFDCENCDSKLDRDLNAAINILDYDKKWIKIYPLKESKKSTVSYTAKACGETKVQNESLVSFNEAGIRQQVKNINV